MITSRKMSKEKGILRIAYWRGAQNSTAENDIYKPQMFNLCWFGGCHGGQSPEFWVWVLPCGSRTSITLAGQKAPLRRPLTPYHLKPRLLNPCPGGGGAEKLGEDTHIVPLVKVDGAGDRRETLRPVVTVPVHS